MIFSEQNFRRICRGEYGGFESRKFQEALDVNPADPVPIGFEIAMPSSLAFMETKTVMVPRVVAEQYARWAKEEQAPESQLLFFIKPQMHQWILSHRPRMCERLKAAMKSPDKDVQIVWPHETPDVVPYETAKKYVEKYENI